MATKDEAAALAGGAAAASTGKARGRIERDQEAVALGECLDAIQQLDGPAKKRVLEYLHQRFAAEEC